MKIFSGPLHGYEHWQKLVETLRNLDDACYMLHQALMDFIGITFNRNLMLSLIRLCKTLQRLYEQPVSSQSMQSNLTEDFISVRLNLEKFIDEDIRTIKSVQKDEADSLVNLTVIATFLSGVTASMLQIVNPAASGGSTLAVAVNTALFSSLVFSTGSAVQSLLVIMWMRSFVRLPEKSLPHLLHAWLLRGPIISLLVAGALFAVGLILFVYSSQQHSVTSIITTCFATLHTLGIISLAFLYIRDRWKFRRNGGVIGQKLTKSSFLFGAIEGMERMYNFSIPPSALSMSSQERMHEHGPPPTHGAGFTLMEVSHGEGYVDPNLGSQPSPLSFNAQTTPHLEVRPSTPISVIRPGAQAGPTRDSGIARVHELSPGQKQRYSENVFQNSILPWVPFQQPAPTSSSTIQQIAPMSSSTQEVRHFLPGVPERQLDMGLVSTFVSPAYPLPSAPRLPMSVSLGSSASVQTTERIGKPRPGALMRAGSGARRPYTNDRRGNGNSSSGSKRW